MSDIFEMTLNSPITDEQWDAITDVNFDKTDRIWFHTKKGKDVEFAKVIRCKDCRFYDHDKWVDVGWGSQFLMREWCSVWERRITTEDGYCYLAKRKEE